MRRQDLIDRMKDFIEEFDIQGIITLMATTWRANTTLLDQWRLINERLGVPVLNLDADMSGLCTFSEAKGKK